MKAFIERFYHDIDRNLGDPHSSVRFPKEDKLQALHDTDQEIFEELLKLVGMESWMGYSETEITIEDGVSFYQFPPGFRHFVQMEHRDALGRIDGVIRSKSYYSHDYGVDVLTADRGFRLFPAPILSTGAIWHLIYLRSPGLLHYAKAKAISDKSLTAGEPGKDAGELVGIDDYYNGTELRIYSSGNSAHPQTREVLGYKNGVFILRHAWNPLPEGEVWYETVPTLPFKYDSLYAIDVALSVLPQREKGGKAIALLRPRKKKWSAARQYFAANVSDRAPTRLRPLTRKDQVATGEVPWF